MRIRWFGHSSFLITAENGTRIIMDPYESGAFHGACAYEPINEHADIVVVSHEHYDHAYVAAVTGTPIIIDGAGLFVASGIEFSGVETSHDTGDGKRRGKNVVYSFTVDGVKVCHLGDLGHVLTDDQAAEIGVVDVLLTPVGGHFTIGADQAWEVADQLSARIVIPMHYKTDKCHFPLATLDEFLKGKQNVARPGVSEITIKRDELPEEREIVVMEHAR